MDDELELAGGAGVADRDFGTVLDFVRDLVGRQRFVVPFLRASLTPFFDSTSFETGESRYFSEASASSSSSELTMVRLFCLFDGGGAMPCCVDGSP